MNQKPLQCKLLSFEIYSDSQSDPFTITNAWVVPNLSDKYQKYNPNSIKLSYTHLRDIPVPKLHLRDVTLTIGTDFPKLLLNQEYNEGTHFEPYAIKIYLGWVLMGGNKRLNTSVNSNLTQTFNVERFWKTENYGTVPKHDDRIVTKDEKRALNILQNTISFKEGKYKTGLLWREDKVNLPNNRQLAVQSLQSLEKKLARNEGLKTKYHKTVKQYIDNNNATKIPPEDLTPKKASTRPIIKYIPHHAVLNQYKPDKVCVVYEAAAKYRNCSLNDHLLKCPDLLNNLVSIVIRFRLGKFAVTNDIEQIFHQLHVRKEDRDALQFLWREIFICFGNALYKNAYQC